MSNGDKLKKYILVLGNTILYDELYILMIFADLGNNEFLQQSITQALKLALKGSKPINLKSKYFANKASIGLLETIAIENELDLLLLLLF